VTAVARAGAPETALLLLAAARAGPLDERAAADALYREAIERLSRIQTRGCETLARTHLLYGE
jgi:hypothetical protein